MRQNHRAPTFTIHNHSRALELREARKLLSRVLNANERRTDSAVALRSVELPVVLIDSFDLRFPFRCDI
jgi:hypothetical protein